MSAKEEKLKIAALTAKEVFTAPVSLTPHGTDNQLLQGDVKPLLPLLKEWGIHPTTVKTQNTVTEAYIIPQSKVMDLIDAIDKVNKRLS